MEFGIAVVIVIALGVMCYVLSNLYNSYIDSRTNVYRIDSTHDLESLPFGKPLDNPYCRLRPYGDSSVSLDDAYLAFESYAAIRDGEFDLNDMTSYCLTLRNHDPKQFTKLMQRDTFRSLSDFVAHVMSIDHFLKEDLEGMSR
ncbi:MAG: hypothetical protein MK052_03595 [Alphaproteobacteria bacterium]|nr:hypothetical protein [Alphaproteobacteria bacterium]